MQFRESLRIGYISLYRYTECSSVLATVGDIGRYSQGFAGEGTSNESVVVDKAIFASFEAFLPSEHFTYIATPQLSRDTTVGDIGDISRPLDCFTSHFS